MSMSIQILLPAYQLKRIPSAKYNYPEYISSLIGYTGKISTDEYNELSKDDDSYTQMIWWVSQA